MSERKTVLLSLDAGSRREKTGVRVNLAQENIDPLVKDAKGDRSLLALDQRLSENEVLEFELEWSRKSQPTAPGFSLLGNNLPGPVDPNLNLNNQDWSRPTVFEGLTGTARYSRALMQTWNMTLTLGGQKLDTDDRLAYPFGCSKENNFDRFCSDGTYDLYDYRSEGEERIVQAGKLLFQGRKGRHRLNIGARVSTSKERMNPQANNLVGEGRVDGSAQLPADPTPQDAATNRSSQNFELFVFDQIEMGKWDLWAGLRQNEVQRTSRRTDKSRPTDLSQSLTLPWGAISRKFPWGMGFVSFGTGAESFVTPNKASYARPGSVLPDVVSQQWELGVKGTGKIEWSLVGFELKRPVVTDAPPEYEVKGETRTRGIELTAGGNVDLWRGDLSVMKLDAKTEGKRPVNVPEHVLRARLARELKSLKGASVDATLIHEGERAVLPDHSLLLPSWTRWDLGMSFVHRDTLVRLLLQNAFENRYWKESPTQYGHVYLYPGAARLWSLTVVQSF